MHEDPDLSTTLPDKWQSSPSVLPPPPTPGKADRLPELAVWACLVIAVVGLFVLSMTRPAPEAPDNAAGSMELRFQGQYVVGINALFGLLGQDLAENLNAQLLAQVRSLATTPAEELCVVPLVAELGDAAQALEEIVRLREKSGLPEGVLGDLALLERLYGQSGALSEEERGGLLERREWFARLALSQGAGPEDPDRREIVARSMRVALLMIGLVMGVGAASVAGLGLLAVGAVSVQRRRLKTRYETPSAALTASRRLPYLETVLVFILAIAVVVPLIFALLRRLTGIEDLPLVLMILAAPAVLWPLVRGLSLPDVRRAYGWHRGRGLWREVGCGLLGYVAGVPLLVVAVLISVAISNLVEKTPYHPLMDELPGTGVGGVLMIYLLACVSAPVLEETVFRGGFYHYLRGRLGMLASAFVVSLVFALIHPQGILGLPPLVALAMILALIREWRGSLVASIAVHALHNGIATTLLLVLLD